jgi:hypothetical protein
MPLAVYSRFVQRVRRRYADELALLPVGVPDRAAIGAVVQQLQARGTSLGAALRIARQLTLERLCVLDVEESASLADITQAMTELAEATLEIALERVLADQDERFGVPRDANGARIDFWIVGMGKLGARELNVSSDIDLVYVYEGDGQTDGAPTLPAVAAPGGGAADLGSGPAVGRSRAHLLLEVLTPIAKSWPSEWCLEANSLAIQVLGGYGYTRDFPVEQYWRDNRLNMIHEGTHGIQALDLLGRKVVMDGGAGLDIVREAIDATIARAAPVAAIAEHAEALRRAAADVAAATRAAWSTGVPAEALANATPYLQAFGHLVLAWVWLDVATCAAAAAPSDAQRGRLAACRYFFRYELPRIGAWLGVVAARDDTCRTMAEESF